MQGRLSPIIAGKIQCFPSTSWREEFFLASQLGFSLMEWTLDQEGLYDNPLMSVAGQAAILDLKKKCGVNILSLTGDCFMQAPFYKEQGQSRKLLLEDLHRIISASACIGIKYILIPLVDNGRLENRLQEQNLFAGLKTCEPVLSVNGQKIVFESDYCPSRLREFIDCLNPLFYGINYDMGNSAALGFNADEEFTAYGDRIDNIHIKDRLLGGTTVPLGTGNADFKRIFRNIHAVDYRGNLILQTARAQNGEHAQVLMGYRDQVLNWLMQGVA